MKSVRQSGTHALIGAVRNRLWLQCAVDAAGRGVRLGGGVLLAGGLYHLFAHAVPTAPLVTLALLPLVVGLVVVLCRQRPGFAAAARAADIWFDGKNLITSAWELLQLRGDYSSTDELVVARAQAVAPQWRRRIAAMQPLRWPHRMTAPFLLALTGLLLLQLPSKEWLTWSQGVDTIQIETLKRDSKRGGGKQNRVEQPASHTLASKRADKDAVTAPSSLPAPFRASSTTPDRALVAAGQAGDTKDKNRIHKADAASSAATPPANHSLAATNGSGKLAGNRGGIRANRDITTKPPSLEVSEVEVRRAAGTQGHAGGGDQLGGIQDPHAKAIFDAVVVPAARHAETGYRADYAPVMRAYVARYFLELKAQVSQP